MNVSGRSRLCAAASEDDAAAYFWILHRTKQFFFFVRLFSTQFSVTSAPCALQGFSVKRMPPGARDTKYFGQARPFLHYTDLRYTFPPAFFLPVAEPLPAEVPCSAMFWCNSGCMSNSIRRRPWNSCVYSQKQGEQRDRYCFGVKKKNARDSFE